MNGSLRARVFSLGSSVILQQHVQSKNDLLVSARPASFFLFLIAWMERELPDRCLSETGKSRQPSAVAVTGWPRSRSAVSPRRCFLTRVPAEQSRSTLSSLMQCGADSVLDASAWRTSGACLTERPFCTEVDQSPAAARGPAIRSAFHPPLRRVGADVERVRDLR